MIEKKKDALLLTEINHPGGFRVGNSIEGKYFVAIYSLRLLQVFLNAVSRSKFFAAELESAVLMWLESWGLFAF